MVGTIGYAPVEEYLFFILQPLLTGLWLYLLLAASPRAPGASTVSGSRRARWAGFAAWAAVSAGGALALRTEAGTSWG